jgi:thiamine biosynthesis protein ThiI
MLYSLVYSEIILKGKNRKTFQNALLKNIRLALGDVSFRKSGGRLLIETPSDDYEKELEVFGRIFGIDYASPVFPVSKDVAAITELLSKHTFKGKICVKTKRADKDFPKSSEQVNREVGQYLVDRGASVDLKNPDQIIFIDILDNHALVYFQKMRCFGGLPVGSGGRVLSLLSGGIDSPVASWFMMKRGCTVDFLHLHNLASNSDVEKSKISRITERLKTYHQPRMRLFIAPYTEFYKATMSLGGRRELVVFRRFMLRLANAIAAEHRAKALVTGDSLGQVASQTLDNLCATDDASSIPVLRPLIGYNKQEIIDLSIKLGLYDDERYRDCCSLAAHSSPSTKVKKEAARNIEKKLEVEKIVEKTMKQTDVIEF